MILFPHVGPWPAVGRKPLNISQLHQALDTLIFPHDRDTRGSPQSCLGRRSSSQCPCPQTNWHAYLAKIADCGKNGMVFLIQYMGLIGFVIRGIGDIGVQLPNESMVYHHFPDFTLVYTMVRRRLPHFQTQPHLQWRRSCHCR